MCPDVSKAFRLVPNPCRCAERGPQQTKRTRKALKWVGCRVRTVLLQGGNQCLSNGETQLVADQSGMAIAGPGYHG